jgi:hypothetical protein
MSRISPGANTGSAQGKGASPLHSENAAPNMVSAVMIKISRRNLGISEQARATEGASKLARHVFVRLQSVASALARAFIVLV